MGPADDLGLPPLKPISRFTELFAGSAFTKLYGATDVAAEYCGLKTTPWYVRGLWKHGWTPEYLKIDPDNVMAVPGSSAMWCWVARKDEEEFLREKGITTVKAIGLPIVYLPEPGRNRIPKSLLV